MGTFLFCLDSLGHSIEFTACAFDRVLRLLLLAGVHSGHGFVELLVYAAQDGQRHLQIAHHLFGCRCSCRRCLALCFEKQLRLGEDTVANGACAFTPSRVELLGRACVAMLFDEDRGQAQAIIGVDARHRHQILHRHLCGDLSFAHVLLDRFRQQIDQRQAARHPARAAIETPCQFVERVVEALFHLRQQPALFQRAFLRTESHRPREQQGVGFVHGPDDGIDRVAAELFERGDAFMAVNDQIAVVVIFDWDDDDGCLLPALSQRGEQVALAERIAGSQIGPAAVELVKLQLHEVQYARRRNSSFRVEGEVRWEVSWDQ